MRCSRREFVDGEATTAFLADAPPRAAPPSREAIALASLLFVERGGPSAPSPGWRASPLRLVVDGAEWGASIRRQGGDWIVTVDAETVTMRLVSRDEAEIRVLLDGVVHGASYRRDGDELWLDFGGACRRFVDRTYAPPRAEDEHADGAVRSPVSGVVTRQPNNRPKIASRSKLALRVVSSPSPEFTPDC